MFIEYNNNPHGRAVEDCVIRAIAKATDQPWEAVYLGLVRTGLEMKDLPNSNTVWASYLRDNDFVMRTLPDTCPHCYTIADFALDHPEGRFVVATGSHAVAVVDGDIYDAWDSSKEVAHYYFMER